MNFLNQLNGYKVYAVAALTVVSALSGALLGQIDWNTAVTLIVGALASATTKAAVAPKN